MSSAKCEDVKKAAEPKAMTLEYINMWITDLHSQVDAQSKKYHDLEFKTRTEEFVYVFFI